MKTELKPYKHCSKPSVLQQYFVCKLVKTLIKVYGSQSYNCSRPSIKWLIYISEILRVTVAFQRTEFSGVLHHTQIFKETFPLIAWKVRRTRETDG